MICGRQISQSSFRVGDLPKYGENEGESVGTTPGIDLQGQLLNGTGVLIYIGRDNGPPRLCLVVLTCGVILISSRGDVSAKGVFMLGVSSVLCATWLSAAAGVYTEYMLKKGANTLWERNIQLASFGVLFALLGILADRDERDKIATHGFFAGYTRYVWGVVFLQSLGGIVTSAVMKYADNIMKVVVKSLAVALSVVISRLCFDEGPDLKEVTFQIGFVAIISSTSMYTLGCEWLRAVCNHSKCGTPSPSNESNADIERPTASKLAVNV